MLPVRDAAVVIPLLSSLFLPFTVADPKKSISSAGSFSVVIRHPFSLMIARVILGSAGIQRVGITFAFQ